MLLSAAEVTALCDAICCQTSATELATAAANTNVVTSSAAAVVALIQFLMQLAKYFPPKNSNEKLCFINS